MCRSLETPGRPTVRSAPDGPAATEPGGGSRAAGDRGPNGVLDRGERAGAAGRHLARAQEAARRAAAACWQLPRLQTSAIKTDSQT